MRKTILIVLFAVSAGAHAANIHYDLGWMLPAQAWVAVLPVAGILAMLLLRRRVAAAGPDRRRAA